MASIEEERRQSLQAAEALSTPPQEDNSRKARIRAEMMARYSGGKQGPADFTKEGEYVKLWKAYKGKNPAVDSILTARISPKEYFSKHRSAVNYTGVGKLIPNGFNLKAERTNLKVTDFTEPFKNDFVSALYNGETPLEELGVAGISDGTRDIYKKVLGKNYEHVTGDNFRGYQLAPESLPFSQELDNMVRSGDYTQKRMGYSPDAERDWALKGNTHFYDAGTHQRIVVDYNGKKYYKLVDVFDTAGTSTLPIAKDVNAAIAEYEIPYVVSTPWRELPAWRE